MTEKKDAPAINIQGGNVEKAGVEAISEALDKILGAPHADEETKRMAITALTKHAEVAHTYITSNKFDYSSKSEPEPRVGMSFGAMRYDEHGDDDDGEDS